MELKRTNVALSSLLDGMEPKRINVVWALWGDRMEPKRTNAAWPILGKITKISIIAENWTQVTRVTCENTYHYTTTICPFYFFGTEMGLVLLARQRAHVDFAVWSSNCFAFCLGWFKCTHQNNPTFISPHPIILKLFKHSLQKPNKT